MTSPANRPEHSKGSEKAEAGAHASHEANATRHETAAALIDEYISCRWADERHKTHPDAKRDPKEAKFCAQIEKQAKNVIFEN